MQQISLDARLYVPAGHPQTDKEREALISVGNTLGIIVERKAMEAKLQDAMQRAARDNQLLNAVSSVQELFIATSGSKRPFDLLLEHLLKLTGSAYGLIAEVLHDPDGTPFLNVLSLSNLAWNAETRAMVASAGEEGLPFRDLDNLLGAPLKTREILICNDRPADPRGRGIPEGHPPIDSLLGIPLMRGDKLSGALYLANRPGGFNSDLIRDLEPLLGSVIGIIEARRNELWRRNAEQELALKGLAGNLGADMAWEAAATLEQGLKQGTLEGAAERFDALDNAVHALVRAAGDLPREHPEAQEPDAPALDRPGPSGDLPARLRELADLLKRQSVDAMALAERIAAQMLATRHAATWRAIQADIDDFAFDAAYRQIEQLLEAQERPL